MNPLKQIYLTAVQLFKRVCLLPQTISTASKQRQQQNALDELEAERLDRIRNPSKYLGR